MTACNGARPRACSRLLKFVDLRFTIRANPRGSGSVASQIITFANALPGISGQKQVNIRCNEFAGKY
jgi:hypothetical protein